VKMYEELRFHMRATGTHPQQDTLLSGHGNAPKAPVCGEQPPGILGCR